MRFNTIKPMWNNFKLYYQLLHLTYLCNLARYLLRTPWGWHNRVETYRSVIICEIFVHLLVMVQNNKICTVQGIKIKKKRFSHYSNIYPTRCNVTQFILSGNCSTCFGWYHHPKHVEQFPDKINCVTFHLVGYILEYPITN